jgi:ribosomal protein S27AE
MSDVEFDVGQWYAENLDKFPDLVSGECEHCGPTEMIVEHDDGTHECYFCGCASEVRVDD